MSQQQTIKLNTRQNELFWLELPVGTIIDIDDGRYEVIASQEDDTCRENCAFFRNEALCSLFSCTPPVRSDHQFIHFIHK